MASAVPVGDARAQAEQLYRTSDAQKGTPGRSLGRRADATVMVRFKAIGNAPIMKVRPGCAPVAASHAPQTNDFRISAFNKFLAVTQFLRKELGLRKNDQIVRAAPVTAFTDY